MKENNYLNILPCISLEYYHQIPNGWIDDDSYSITITFKFIYLHIKGIIHLEKLPKA